MTKRVLSTVALGEIHTVCLSNSISTIIRRVVTMLRRFVLVLVIILVGTIGFVQSVLAQDNCPSAIINDETGTLALTSICEAAKQWSDKGVSLYILYSQASFNNEDSWYKYLDQKETKTGQRLGDNVKTYFLAFEATADGQWTSITQGDYVYYNTPFNKQVDRLKGVLNNGVVAGNATQAFINTLNEGFTIAFPTPVPQQSEQAPVIMVVAPQPTRKPIDWGPIISVAKNVIFSLLSIGAVIAFFQFVVKPGWEIVLKLFQIYKHFSTIKVRTTKLLDGLGRLFEGNNSETMLLFQLLESYGIKKYPKANEEIQEWLRRSKIALTEGTQLRNILVNNKGKRQPIDQQVKAWETLYLTLVGSNPEILKLTDEQITELLDISAGVDTTSDVQLVEQIRAVVKELSNGGYKIEFMLVKPETVDKEGVLGYLKQAKDQLVELRKAKAEAIPRVKEARAILVAAGIGPFPGKLTANQVFFKANKLIAEAEKNIVDKLWLPAIRQAEDAIDLITVGQQSLPTIIQAEEALNDSMTKFEENILLPTKSAIFDYPNILLNVSINKLVENDYILAVSHADDLIKALKSLSWIIVMFLAACKTHQNRLETVEEIVKKGFSLPFCPNLIGEITVDMKKVSDNLIMGDYQQATAMVNELTQGSEALLNQAQAIEKLYNKNLNELKQLSAEVARVSKYNSVSATPAWKLLCEYPQVNRAGIVEIDIPIRTLQDLFDDPKNPDDLASKIAQLNSLEKQQFAKAQEELVVAFARLQEAENQFKAIAERLEKVKEAEKESTKILTKVREEMDTTVTERDKNDKYVDKTVDNQIEQARMMINQVQELIDHREYLEAMRLLLQSRTTLKSALSSINEQAQKILNLLEELESSKAEASKTVDQIVNTYDNLIPILKSSVTGTMVEDAVQKLRRAQDVNERLAGLEDHELESATEGTLALYHEVLESAKQTTRQMEQDKDEYNRAYSDSQQAISSASQAIGSAQAMMNDSDAGSAGESAYRRAQQYLPDSIVYGISISQLQQIEYQAKQSHQAAQQAQRETKAHIDEVKAERARLKQKEKERREREENEERRSKSYYSSSSSFGSSHRPSSFGGSHSSSSFGGSHRR